MDFSDLKGLRNDSIGNKDISNDTTKLSDIGGDFRMSATENLMNDDSPIKGCRKDSDLSSCGALSQEDDDEMILHSASGMKRDLNTHDFYEDGDFF